MSGWTDGGVLMECSQRARVSTGADRVVELVGTGHPALRAGHHKTLELTSAQVVGVAASCVLGVGARLVTVADPALAGPVRVTLSVGDQVIEFDAVANPDWAGAGIGGPDAAGPDAGGPGEHDAADSPGQRPTSGGHCAAGGVRAVLRRSGVRRPDTLAVHSGLVAAGLPRRMRESITDPHCPVRLVVTPVPRREDGRGTLVLGAAGPAGSPGVGPHGSGGTAGTRRWRAELAAADVVVAEDPGAARLIRELAVAGTAVRGSGDPDGPPPPATMPAARRALREGGRVLVVSTSGMPGDCVHEELSRPDRQVVETIGLPPILAVVAASPHRLPAQLIPAGRAPAMVRRMRPGQLTALLAPSSVVAHVLRRARDELGCVGAVLVHDGDPAAGPLRWAPIDRHLATPPAGDRLIACCVDPPSGTEDPVRALVEPLRRAGVPASTLTRAIAGLPGWSRRAAHDLVHTDGGSPGDAPHGGR
jgi:hypothetical protein